MRSGKGAEMDETELLKRFRELADECEDEYPGASGVLRVLTGSIRGGDQYAFYRVCLEFSRRAMARLEATIQRNAGQAWLN